MYLLRRYGTGTGADVRIPLVKRGVVDFAVSADWTPAAGDVKVSKDGGAAANIATLPTALTMGNTALWVFTFSDAELQCKELVVAISDSATKAVEDQAFIVQTYGNASAMIPTDLSASILAVNATQISGDATAADNCESFFDGTGYAGTNNVIPTVTSVTNRVTANTDQIEGSDATNQIRDSVLSDATRFAGADIAAIKAKTDHLTFTNANKVDASTLALGNDVITAAAIATDAIDADALKTDAITEIAAGVGGRTVAAPTAAPTAPYTEDEILGFLIAILKFKRTQTATTETLFQDDGSTTLATAAKSDNGTSFVRGEYS